MNRPVRQICAPTSANRYPRLKALTTRHWSDWVGTVAFTAIGVGLWRRSPEFGVLILPGLIQELLVIISFLVRGRARSIAAGCIARFVAYVNSFLIIVLILAAARYRTERLRPRPDVTIRWIGAILWLSGAVLCRWPLWYLRRSFSLEPEARTLVTSGPYRFARHP